MPPPKQKKQKKQKNEKREPQHEYEVRYLSWDRKGVLDRAASLIPKKKARGDHAIHRVLLINSIYERPDIPDLIIRIRQSVTARGIDSTLTAKLPGKGRYELESETRVSDPVQTELILEMAGCKRKHTTQKFRDTLDIPGLGRLDMDHHPGLPPLLEVEAPTEHQLHVLLTSLGLQMPSDIPTPRPERMYETHYGVSPDRKPIGDMTFKDPSNVSEHIKKNRATFERILREQRKEAASLLRMNFS